MGGGYMLSTKIRNGPLTHTDQSLAHAFKAPSNIDRYRIFRILSLHPRLSLTDISEVLDLSTPLMSLHAAVLVQAKLLQKKQTRKGSHDRLEVCNLFVQSVVQTI
jgi:DNA-binding transcriptional ArsR family regulator